MIRSCQLPRILFDLPGIKMIKQNEMRKIMLIIFTGDSRLTKQATTRTTFVAFKNMCDWILSKIWNCYIGRRKLWLQKLWDGNYGTENEKEAQNLFQIWETFPCWSFNPARYWGWPLTPPLWIEIYGDSAGLTAWPPLTSADTLNNYPVLLMMRDGLSVLPVYLPNRWPGPHSGRLLDGWLAGQMVG